MARKEVKKGFRKLSLLLAFALMASLVLNVTFVDVKVQAAEIPARYDGREFQTPIRDQGRSELCWAFSTIAAIEASAVKNMNADKKTLDLSEYHLAYFTFANKKDPLNLTNNDIIEFKNSSYNFINNGGNPGYPLTTLISGVGPVNESDAPMSTLLDEDGNVRSGAHAIPISDSLRRGKNAYDVKNVYMYSIFDPDQRNNVKSAIQKYGAVATAYYSSAHGNYNRDANGEIAYYQETVAGFDHGIAIVGWDDNYSVENFKSELRPSNNGAWLVKNSWGEAGDKLGYTKDGYFWLSYEDKSFASGTTNYGYAYELRPVGQYKYTYQYDGGIIHEYSSTPIEETAESYANIFTATGNQRLEALGIQTDRGYANAPCLVKIYTGVTTGPESGTLVSEENIVVPGNGYYTFTLSSPVEIENNQKFSVVITPTDEEALTYICTDRSYYPKNGNSNFKVTNHTEANQSFIKERISHQWNDLKYESYYYFDDDTSEDGTSLCIKAFTSNRKTTPTPSNPSSPTTSNPSSGGGGSGGGASGGGASGGSTSQSSNNEITILGDTSKNLSAKVEKNNVTVSNIDESVINSVINSGSHTNAKEVTLDLSKADTNVSSVTITGNTINAISKVLNRKEELKDSFAIKLPNANLIFDKAALSSIATQAKTDEISVVVENTLLSQLNENQKASAEEVLNNKGKSLDMVFEAYISKGGDRISDFEGGSVRVSKLDFKIPNGKNPKFYHVYYLPDKGAPVRHETWYENDILHFKTNHFSDYAIVYDESMENGKQTPVYRLFHSKLGDHLLTKSVAERDAVQKIGYKLESIAFYASGTGNKVYRLYNRNSGEHFYTASEKERDLCMQHNWKLEGVAFTTEGQKKVYRLSNGKVHFFTTSEKEMEFCKAHGWKLEGVGFTAN